MKRLYAETSDCRRLAPTPAPQAFTLIELLIVVAIIAILALIAVPNFLEAQTRAKVSRAKTDLRTYTTALEAYFVDWNSYVNDHDSNYLYYSMDQNGLTKLISPVAYLTSLPRDPFGEIMPIEGFRYMAWNYEGGSGEDNVPIRQRHAYLLIGLGPDGWDNTDGNDDFPFTDRMLSYDPTNGTVSLGEIYRVLGDWKSGFIRDWDGRAYGGL